MHCPVLQLQKSPVRENKEEFKVKKSYNKPEIYFESFSLSTSIASGCEVPFTLAARNVCGIPDANGLNMNVFDPGAGGTCVISGTGNEEYNGLCYHIPTETNNLFKS